MTQNITFYLETLDSTDSTMNDCSKRIGNPLLADPSYMAYRAVQQSAGRGLPDKASRQSRVWSSPPGNLYLSYILPDEGVTSTWQATFPAGLIMRETLTPYLRQGLGITLKWPNDFFMEDQKFGGVLVERYHQHLIVGIGITINTYADPAQIRGGAGYQTTRLADHSDVQNIDPAKVAEDFLDRMAAFVNNPQSTAQVMADIGFLRSEDDPTVRFQIRAAGDKPFPDTQIFEGRFQRFVDDTSLEIETEEGTKPYAIRDVLFRLFDKVPTH